MGGGTTDRIILLQLATSKMLHSFKISIFGVWHQMMIIWQHWTRDNSANWKDKRTEEDNKLSLTSKAKQKIRPPNLRQLNWRRKKNNKQMTKPQSSRQHKRLRKKQLKMKETCKPYWNRLETWNLLKTNLKCKKHKTSWSKPTTTWTMQISWILP